MNKEQRREIVLWAALIIFFMCLGMLLYISIEMQKQGSLCVLNPKGFFERATNTSCQCYRGISVDLNISNIDNFIPMPNGNK